MEQQTKTDTSPAPSSGSEVAAAAPSARTRALRGMDFAAGQAALAPDAGPPVQRKVDDVKGLDRLKSGEAPVSGAVEDTANFKSNTTKPEDPLPWTESGWNAQAILTHLGQYDRLKGTDSDGRRCVQAVALASHVLGGPEATASFLGAVAADGLRIGPPTPRASAAIGVLGEVRALISAKKATYGDLSWAQEAAHDLSYADDVGTPEAGVKEAVVPSTDSSKMQTLSAWCATPGEMLALANALKDKEQLLVCTWSVTFNANIDAGEDEQELGYKDGDGSPKTKTVHRIDTKKKPPASAIDAPGRDAKSGHQLLVYKTGGKIWFYDPEITKSGQHLSEVGKDGKELASAFKDYPKFEMFGYIEVLGKVTPPV